MLQKADTSNPYTSKPSAAKPYSAGSLQSPYIQEGLNALNFYRYVSGLPADITTTAKLNEDAQYGSVLLASEGEFDHRPSQPNDMPQAFYDRGFASTTSSNIFASYGYGGNLLVNSIHAYMDDSDTSNLSVIGHRRWILNPPLQETGFGLASGKDGWSYSALQIFDQSRAKPVSFRYIAYPAGGYFPTEVMKPTTAWSVSPNPELYEVPAASKVKITVTRERDSKTWKLSSADNKVTEAGRYMNVETEGYGSGPAIIFRMDGIGSLQAGERYHVQVDGLGSLHDGSPASITYTVQFFSVSKPPVPVPDPNSLFTDIAKHWAKPAIEWAGKEKIASGFPDGSFRPDTRVTEEQWLKLMLSLYWKPANTASDRWSDPYYEYAEQQDLPLLGSSNSKAKQLPITRLAVAELIAAAEGQSLKGDSAIQYLYEHQYSEGKTGSMTIQDYDGASSLSRAEGVQFIKNLADAGFHSSP